MLSTLLRLRPVILGIAAGYSLRRLPMVNHHDGETVFKLVFYVPARRHVHSTVHCEVEPGGWHSFRWPHWQLARPANVWAGYLTARLVAVSARFDPVQAAVLTAA